MKSLGLGTFWLSAESLAICSTFGHLQKDSGRSKRLAAKPLHSVVLQDMPRSADQQPTIFADPRMKTPRQFVLARQAIQYGNLVDA
jgi:hypothetical protein